MRYLYIGFSTSKKKKIGAEIIKWWLKTPYSHVYLRFESSNQLLPNTVYHASHGMVHFRTFYNFLKENTVVKEFCIKISPEQYYKILSHAMQLSGEPYGYCELVQIGLIDILYKLGIKHSVKDNKGYICSELVGKFLSEDLKVNFNKPIFLLTPKDIYKVLEEGVIK